MLLVVAGPSGVGKGTIVRELKAQFPELWESVSYTTRPPRPTEVDGVDYRFVTRDDFEALIDAVSRRFGVAVDVVEFDEHAMSAGREAKALASVTVEVGGKQASACCIDEDTSLASLQATLSAIGRAITAQALRQAI